MANENKPLTLFDDPNEKKTFRKSMEKQVLIKCPTGDTSVCVWESINIFAVQFQKITYQQNVKKR